MWYSPLQLVITVEVTEEAVGSEAGEVSVVAEAEVVASEGAGDFADTRSHPVYSVIVLCLRLVDHMENNAY